MCCFKRQLQYLQFFSFSDVIRETFPNQGCQMVYFKPKIPIWVNFGESSKGKNGIYLWPFELCYINLVCFMAILWSFGIIFQF
jgi:hypothetical protein